MKKIIVNSQFTRKVQQIAKRTDPEDLGENILQYYWQLT
jgi:hypothetical protein